MANPFHWIETLTTDTEQNGACGTPKIASTNGTELRQGFNAGNAPVVRQQCLDCGYLKGNPVKRTPEMNTLAAFDQTLAAAYDARRKSELADIRRRYVALQTSRWRGSAAGKTFFQNRHADYLASHEWKERSSLVMQRASGLCEGCRKNRATEVHHLTYSNWGKEFLYELVALCGECHDRVHQLNEDRDTGCTECVHCAEEGRWCRQFDMPTNAALSAEGECGPQRKAFVASEYYGTP